MWSAAVFLVYPEVRKGRRFNGVPVKTSLSQGKGCKLSLSNKPALTAAKIASTTFHTANIATPAAPTFRAAPWICHR